ncbi:unnamed protein product [Lymnaea stagnalis]|uniref:Uncharacterized protein n=1 Tax=Lymnaea stagnalis TaxID=6523 RepID=A0AAV2HNX0_LYMST
MDFSKLCKEYCKVYNISGEPNLDLLKLSIEGDVTWTESTTQLTSQEATSRQLNVMYTPSQRELYSDVETTRESVCKTKVTIHQGLAPGLNKPLKVPTSNMKQPLGKYVEIQPGKSTHERENKMMIKLGSAHRMDSSNPAVATVSDKETHYIGRFSCKVKLGGKVLIPHDNVAVEEFGIADIVNDVKLWPPVNQQAVGKDVNALEIVRGEDKAPQYVTWDVVGTCEFQGDFEQTIKWS